jgi:hypothetical protein
MIPPTFAMFSPLPEPFPGRPTLFHISATRSDLYGVGVRRNYLCRADHAIYLLSYLFWDTLGVVLKVDEQHLSQAQRRRLLLLVCLLSYYYFSYTLALITHVVTDY